MSVICLSLVEQISPGIAKPVLASQWKRYLALVLMKVPIGF
ncbi:MAG: hypothetical protein AB9Q19_01475 [Candidatus Reddybacter sp.]